MMRRVLGIRRIASLANRLRCPVRNAMKAVENNGSQQTAGDDGPNQSEQVTEPNRDRCISHVSEPIMSGSLRDANISVCRFSRFSARRCERESRRGGTRRSSSRVAVIQSLGRSTFSARSGIGSRIGKPTDGPGVRLGSGFVSAGALSEMTRLVEHCDLPESGELPGRAPTDVGTFELRVETPDKAVTLVGDMLRTGAGPLGHGQMKAAPNPSESLDFSRKCCPARLTVSARLVWTTFCRHPCVHCQEPHPFVALRPAQPTAAHPSAS